MDQSSATGVKPKIKSKTLWFNAALTGAAAIMPTVVDSIPVLQPYAGKFYPALLFTATVGNAVLRYYTKEPIRATPDQSGG